MGYDAIVVGGGHNGLVAGFYLARAGLRTVILERRDIVGGACVTEEFAPGFRASTGAYVLSMLRESIWRDMRLVQRGIRVDAAGPTLNVFPDGAHYTVGDDWRTDARRDAALLPPRRATRSCGSKRTSDGSPGGDPVLRTNAARPTRPERARSARAGARWARIALRHRRDLLELAFLFTDIRHAVLGRAVRVRARDGRARLARDQRQRRRPFHAGDRVRVAARSRERGDRRWAARLGVRARWHGSRDGDDGGRGARGRRRGPNRRPRSSASSR